MDYRSGTMFRITVRIWGSKYEAGTLDENAQAADPPKKYETKIATLVRLVGRQAREIEFLKRALKRPTAEKRDYVSHFRAFDLSIACGMSADGSAPIHLLRRAGTRLKDTEIVGRMQAFCDEFEAYGYRRVVRRSAARSAPNLPLAIQGFRGRVISQTIKKRSPNILGLTFRSSESAISPSSIAPRSRQIGMIMEFGHESDREASQRGSKPAGYRVLGRRAAIGD